MVNVGRTDPVDVLKFVSIFVAYLAGRISRQSLRIPWLSVVLLVGIPLLLLPFGSRIYYVSEGLGDLSFSYFMTRNAAVIYYTAVIFYLYSRLGRYSVPIQLLVAIAFGKIGAILGSVAAYIIWNVRFDIRAIALMAVGLIIGIVGFALGAFDRVFVVMGPLWSDLTNLGPERISQMDYGDIALRTGSSDVSGYFRIKHWYNIWDIYSKCDYFQIIFGYGPGQTKIISDMKLVPHNDYLRILCEFGVANFILFISIIIIALRNLESNVLKSIFSVYVIYSMFDNLIDNFTSILMLFGGAGLYAKHRVQPLTTRRATDPSAHTIQGINWR